MHHTEILNLAARAWHETKADADPEFNDCALTHRENLAAATKAVVDSGGAFNHFDRVVQRLHQADLEAKSEIEKLQSAHPGAHADTLMHLASGEPHPLQAHADDAAREAAREEMPISENIESVEGVTVITDDSAIPDDAIVIEPPKGKLPEDFPGLVALDAAGIHTFAQLRKHGWVDVKGIGPATAEKITERLRELGETVADTSPEDKKALNHSE